MTALLTQIYRLYISLERLTLTKVREPCTVIFGCPAPWIFWLKYWHFLRHPYGPEMPGRRGWCFPAATLSKCSNFRFRPCHVLLGMYTSDHVTLVHVQSRKKSDVYASGLWNCADGIATWTHRSACVRIADRLRTAVRMNGDRPT